MIAADTTLVVAVVSSLTSLGAAGLAAFGVWYGAKRKGDVDEVQASVVAEQSLVDRAQKVLMETIGEMRIEMARQDADHERAIEQLRAEHERAMAAERASRERQVGNLQQQITEVREHHAACMERNSLLERELAELRRGR